MSVLFNERRSYETIMEIKCFREQSMEIGKYSLAGFKYSAN